MKQFFTIILAFLIMTVSGCSSKNNSNENLVSGTSDIISSRQENNTSQTDTSNSGSDDSTTTEGSEKTTEPPSTDSTSNLPPSGAKTENTNNESKAPAQKTETTATEDKKPASTESKPKETPDPITSPDPEDTPPQAVAADTEKIAVKVVEYINEYRRTEGAQNTYVLSGLTEYAKYRSRQLVKNFAHDTTDERSAATALKYGQYIEPSMFGLDGEPYYTANVREAIGKGSLFGTVEQAAKRIATGFRNSQGHWCYVGNNEYKYIAVGVTCENGYWYCDIAVSTVNTDN